MRWRALIISLSLLGSVNIHGEDLLLYAPFDAAADAAIARGNAANLGGLAVGFTTGMRGQAFVLRTDCRFAVERNFRPQAGTVAVWVRPHWDGAEAASHYVFCIYGQRDLPHSWAVNRFNVAFGAGRCAFTIFTSAEGKTFSVSAPVDGWKKGQWHHVAATWANVNSGKPDGEMRLYLDGALSGRVVGKQIDVGPTDTVMGIGRDQDASPDYGDADFDDLFIYGRPLTDAEIAAGVARVKAAELYDESVQPSAGPPLPGWWRMEWPFRVKVPLPAEPGAFVQCPLKVAADLTALGVNGMVNHDSVQVVEDGAKEPLPRRVADGLVEWQTPKAARGFHLYFDTHRYSVEAPLVAKRKGVQMAETPTPPPAPDYATLAYGKPWDFDDGTFSGIDQWGDKPEFLRNKKVQDGILSMDVSQDPFFIWGDMWGQVQKVGQKVAIDLDKFPVLEMKVRQSVSRAMWELYGRPGTSDHLLHHEFPVSGSGWQRLRIDLKKEARWRGVLSAFRIDPTKLVDAHVEIDWVRLTAVTPVEHGRVETVGERRAVPARIGLETDCGVGQLRNSIEASKTALRAGSAQDVRVSLTDASGKGVARHPVRVELASGSGGELADSEKQKSLALSPQSRRGLTDEAGRLAVRHIVSRKAAKDADTLIARVEFADVPEAKTTVSTVAGPPHHYRVEPRKVVALKASDLPLAVSAQLVDEFDNPVGETRRITWETDEGAKVLDAAMTLSASGLAKATWKGDDKARWVFSVRVKDDRGLSGESAAICLLPSEPRTNPIVLGPNGYFRRGREGKAWLPLGGFYANWVGLPEGGEEGRKLISFVDATEEQLAHWLDFLARQGVTAMRFMLRAHTKRGMEPMDVIGRVNMPLFAKVLRYLDLARQHDIRFMLTLHEDYTKPAYYNQHALETFCIPQYAGEDLDKLPPHQRRFIRDRRLIGLIDEKYTDPDVLACQDQYARQLVALLKDNPQLFAWEFENEMLNCPREWANHAAAVIRSVDAVTPLCASHGGGGLHTADPLWWARKTAIDFYTYHLYAHPGSTSAEIDYGAAVDVLTCYGRMAGVCMMGESAGDEFSRYPKERDADRRYLMRDIIWFSLVNGNPGCFFWNARGFEVEQFRLASRIAHALDWRDWKRQRPEMGLIVAHPWDDDKYYRTPEGRADYALMGRHAQHFLSAGVDFDFTMDGAGYARTATLKASAPSAWEGPRIAVSPGWQVRFNAREGWREGLAYVRNFAGIRHWQQPRVNMHIRDRKPAPLTIRLDLPLERIAVTATDLDTGEETRLDLKGGGEMDFGVTEHDWALVWRASPQT